MKGGAPIRDDIHLLLIGDPGLAKCVKGDTNIVLADGSISKISDIVEEVLETKEIKKVEDGICAFSNHNILSLGLSCRTEQTKATVFWKLDAPETMYKIRTYTGKEITTTPEHPFFVSSNGLVSSIKAKDIKPGEFIASPRMLNITGAPQRMPERIKDLKHANRIRLPENITPEFARFLGYLTGDGYVRKTTSYEISFTNEDEELLADFGNILSSYSLHSKVKKDRRNGLPTCFAFSSELGSVLEALGAIKTSFSKHVPQEICKSENSVVKEFIKAYFDCEAHVRHDSITVSASKKLLEQVQILLLRFGIICQLHPTKSRATNAKNHQLTTYHRLVLCGDNARRYASTIGFVSSRKNSRTKLLEKKSNPNLDVVPNIGNVLKEIRIMLKISQFDCGVSRTTYQHFERGDRNPSRKTLSRIVEAFEQHYENKQMTNKSIAEKISLIKTLANSDVFWDKIVSIEKTAPDSRYVYDLQVDNLHNFIANGLIAHNTRFVQQAAEIAPKSIYVSGKTVSGVGLTVSAEKDELGEGGWTLKAGALVLASGGLAGIDEFDKIDDEDRAALHEVMESQRVSIAKAGIVAQFSAKCAIIAAANPKYGRFDQNKNLAEQFEVPPTLLSRFDLIFPIVDVLDPEKDAKLAQHILETHMGKFTEQDSSVVLVDRDFLRKYVAYARRNCSPKLSESAMEKIRDFYVEMRRMGKDVGSVTITPRYLEGLVRLAEANAKVRLSPIVEGKDAEVSINLMRYVMRQIMTDKATGVFDVDTVATGKPKSEREKLQKFDVIMDIIREMLKMNDSADIEEVIKEAEGAGVDESSARKIIAELLRKGDIYEKEHGHVKIVGERK
jgi:replicative DNA helicase Mcm